MLRALILGVCLAAPLAAQSVDRRTAPTETPVPARSTLSSSVVTGPVVLVREPEQKYVVVKIRVGSELELEGSWYAPRRGKKNVPGVLLVHDAGRDRKRFEGLAERIHKVGLAVLTIDLRGHGGSKTEKLDWEKLDEDGQKSLWVYATKDVDAAVKWLRGQDGIHSTRLCMVGHGAGCALTASHMKNEDNAVAVVLLEPPAKAYGFDVRKDIIQLDGLPTRLIADRDNGSKAVVEAMVDEAKEMSTGDPVIDILLARPPVLEDKATFRSIAEFLKVTAIPSKGR